jgi:phosphoribosylglycinamide formyltransferase-1
MSDTVRVGILISGRGSNMVALVEAMRSGAIPAEPAVVLSNVPDSAGLARANELGVPTEVVDSKRVKPRKVHERQVIELLRCYDVDLLCLAGYMRLLTADIISEFRGRILNIHPSLLPAFPGLNAQQQALDHGVKVAGCTVHIVDEECDHGPIVLQSSVAVRDADTVESLSARILEQEHLLYPRAVELFCTGRLQIDGRRVTLSGQATP